MSDATLSHLALGSRATGVPRTAHAAGGPRLKVLACAYACNPSKGSEAGVGWGWVKSISKYHDLWVITGQHERQDIESELERQPELRKRISFHYIRRIQYRLAEKLWPPMYLYTYTHQWQEAAYELGRQLHEQIKFDVIHQLTYVGFRVPGLLWKLDAPFVWGPIGGLEQTTWALIPALGVRGGVYFLLRNILNDWDRRMSSKPKRAFARAEGGIIAATTGIQTEIRRFYRHASTVISEVGLPPIKRATPTRRPEAEPLQLIWCGNLLPGKALPFLLEALAIAPQSLRWKLTIIGEGPCALAWQHIARKLGVADRIEWLGKVPRQAVLQQMQRAHALVITSVYDLTSTVLVEALANGLPVICPDHCGFSDAITSTCGIKVSASSKRNLVNGISEAIAKMNGETLRYQLAEGAFARSSNYDWDLKAQMVSDVYYKKIPKVMAAKRVNVSAAGAAE